MSSNTELCSSGDSFLCGELQIYRNCADGEVFVFDLLPIHDVSPSSPQAERSIIILIFV